MSFKFWILLLFSCWYFPLCAQQTYSIKGSINDTTRGAGISNATVCVLKEKDSTLVKFTYSSTSGAFLLDSLPSGQYLLLVTYPKFGDYVERFSLDSVTNRRDFGNIALKSRLILLNEVIIKARAIAIRKKGDTIEYNAKSYVVQPNDKVEDLLTQLPGITVDNNGKITVNGIRVNSVLVDGEEFFNDDPTLVTKNIRADMVDKIQVYDKKSDQATFTGIDDGVKNKTINVKLKENKKDGLFGKVSAGLGTGKYYEGQGIINRFKNNEKYSAYGTVGNDGRVELTSTDGGKIGVKNIEIVDNGLVAISAGGTDALDSFDGIYNGVGIPVSRSGGMHYDSKWDAGAQSINANYQIGSVEISGNTYNDTQKRLPGNLFTNSTNESFKNYSFQNKLAATYSVRLDSTADLTTRLEGLTTNFHVNNEYSSTTRVNFNNLLNQQHRSISNDGGQRAYNISAFYEKKLKKPRRTFSWEINESYNRRTTEGFLISNIDFFNTSGNKDSSETTNQYKKTLLRNSAFNNNFTYTEPLWDRTTISLNYGLGLNFSNAERRSYNASAPGGYDMPDTSYSNSYNFHQFANQLGAILSYSTINTFINFGTKVSEIDFKQKDVISGKIYKREFTAWNPKIVYWHKLSDQADISMYYIGSAKQPSVEQLQPVRSNIDPLNISLGDPVLRPSFLHTFNFNYHLINSLRNSSALLQGTYSLAANDIVNDITTDEQSGKTIVRYRNLSERLACNYFFFATYGGELRPLNIGFNIDLDTRGSTTYDYINQTLNKLSYITYTTSVSVNKNKTNKYNIYVSASWNYTINKFSLLSLYNNNAPGLQTRLFCRIFLPFRSEISTDVSYAYTAKTQTFDALHKTIWNATLSKNFFNNSLKLSLSGKDLLNQNRIFSRIASESSVSQSSSTCIKRYFMVSISWDFTKFHTITTKF